MRRNGLLAIVLVLVVALAAGVIWATGTNPAVEEQKAPEPTEAPQTPTLDVPLKPVPAEEVAFCAGAGTCNSVPCPPEDGCNTTAVFESEDLGFRCCFDRGVLLQCPVGQTVQRTTAPCGKSGPSTCPPQQITHFCE